jgi:hypothetical protein
MKNFQSYIAELNHPYQFRVKLCGVEPVGETLTRIKNALETYQLVEMGSVKRLPIQEDRDFPKMGPCQCYLFEVTVKYPTTPNQLRQIVSARAQIDPECVCVYNEDTAAQEDAVQERINKQGPVLTEPEMTTDSAPPAGQQLVDSFIKELSTKKFEFAGKSDADGKTTNDVPQNTKSVLKPNTSPRGK